jgi:hypothetical protein
LKLQQFDLVKQYHTPQRLLEVQEQLLGFINKEVIPPSGRHHVAKFAVGQESAPPPSPSKKKNQRASNSSVNKQSK